jgi:hypothetical protein
MAIKKALYGRQPDSIYFFGFCFHFSWMRVILFEYYFCVLAVARICFSVSTVAKINCQVLPTLGVLRLQNLFGVAEICAANFFIFYL